jgi:hypothetical protein
MTKTELKEVIKNVILEELKNDPCWKGYEMVGMKDKNGKSVPNCVPIKENEESNNYMFWQNLKTINHATSELLKMDVNKLDMLLADGHGWALDHVSTSADDIEEVYHFVESNINESRKDSEDEHTIKTDEELLEFLHFLKEDSLINENLKEAEYRGRKVKLNKPMRGDVKKFKVFVKDPKSGNIKKVNFGDPKMRIKKNNPKRRKSFRARFNCENPGPKTKARYWSCRKW